MIKHIIFDWDNTLSMTEYANFLAENEGARLLGVKPQSRELHKKTAGMEFRDALNVRFPEADPDELMNLISTKIFPKYLKEGIADSVSDRTANALKKLKNKGYILHILTSRREAVVSHIIDEDHMLNEYITDIFYLEKTKFKKPDPRVFDSLLKEIKATPDECLYVGDAPDDSCASKAGIFFIVTLESGLRTKEDFKDYSVDEFISDLSELPVLLKNLSSKVN
ncbi:MAG: HAD family hydrolase [bacterium]